MQHLICISAFPNWGHCITQWICKRFWNKISWQNWSALVWCVSMILIILFQLHSVKNNNVGTALVGNRLAGPLLVWPNAIGHQQGIEQGIVLVVFGLFFVVVVGRRGGRLRGGRLVVVFCRGCCSFAMLGIWVDNQNEIHMHKTVSETKHNNAHVKLNGHPWLYKHLVWGHEADAHGALARKSSMTCLIVFLRCLSCNDFHKVSESLVASHHHPHKTVMDNH